MQETGGVVGDWGSCRRLRELYETDGLEGDWEYFGSGESCHFYRVVHAIAFVPFKEFLCTNCDVNAWLRINFLVGNFSFILCPFLQLGLEFLPDMKSTFYHKLIYLTQSTYTKNIYRMFLQSCVVEIWQPENKFRKIDDCRTQWIFLFLEILTNCVL